MALNRNENEVRERDIVYAILKKSEKILTLEEICEKSKDFLPGGHFQTHQVVMGLADLFNDKDISIKSENGPKKPGTEEYLKVFFLA